MEQKDIDRIIAITLAVGDMFNKNGPKERATSVDNAEDNSSYRLLMTGYRRTYGGKIQQVELKGDPLIRFVFMAKPPFEEFKNSISFLYTNDKNQEPTTITTRSDDCDINLIALELYEYLVSGKLPHEEVAVVKTLN